MSNSKFTSKDIEAQKVYENESWNLLLPRGPFSPFHLMFVVKDASVVTFDELNDTQVIQLREGIDHVIGRMRQRYAQEFQGYNLFSNNGEEKIGQHMKHFHQHIFLRLALESESPYVAMANNRKWALVDTPEWQVQRQLLIDLFS